MKLISKVPILRGGGLAYFLNYGIDPNKFISMFGSLKKRGLSNQVAFEITWQSLKEVPNGFYSFGKRFSNVDDWADNVVNHQLKRSIYKNAVNAKNFDEYRKATFLYNKSPNYTNWLKTGREEGRLFINNYIQLNNLGEPVAMQNNFNNEDVSYAKSGIKIKKKNKGKFTEYCGGEVTLDCILKGKNSKSKLIRKRATFADNARKWKKC